ncbi:MAG: entry exclusion 1 domain-containing protein [Alphaproteobacteria bacterium]|jgi:chromosome segregation ATPase|nr:entry exclusion 1 domain-containing protein [Alphaproteobacteria bacterium]MBP9867866.1 entry exclusion 1 domain-containing protein [Alphaproteobacteria bacterium]
MAKVGAQRAAIMTGRSKSTIQRAMKAGRLSFEIDDQGQKLVDISELERVFGPVTEQEENTSLAAVKAEIKRAHEMLEMERLKMRVHSLEDQLHITQVQLDDVKEQRDQWQKQAQQVLLTNQFSQKQAEDLKQELRDREARERAIRQRQMEDRLRRMQAQNQNNENSDENNIWGRLLKKIGGIR